MAAPRLEGHYKTNIVHNVATPALEVHVHYTIIRITSEIYPFPRFRPNSIRSTYIVCKPFSGTCWFLRVISPKMN